MDPANRGLYKFIISNSVEINSDVTHKQFFEIIVEFLGDLLVPPFHEGLFELLSLRVTGTEQFIGDLVSSPEVGIRLFVVFLVLVSDALVVTHPGDELVVRSE